MSGPGSAFEVGLAALAAAGINFYARDPARAIATLDVDVLLAPRAANLRAALRALSGCGFRFESGGEPFLDIDDDSALATIVERSATRCARHSSAAQLDLMVAITGFSYAELAADSVHFEVAGSEIAVGRLGKLLRSKQLSGRPKDVAFLESFEAQAEEDESE